MEKVNVCGKTPQEMACLLRCPALYFVRSQILEVLWNFHRPLDPETVELLAFDLHTVRHVYRSVWPARETKPRFGAALER